MTKPELALWGNNDGTGRSYRHPFRTTEDDKPLTSPSVTTILKLVDKGGLSQWAANLTLEWAVSNAALLLSRSDEDGFRAGRYRWKDVRDERAEVGTGIHETIEAMHTGSWDYPVLDAEQQAIMEQWRALNERYEFTPHRTEVTIWNLKEDYAGTADGVWDILDRESGEFYENALVDLKTSRSTWPEHWMQLAALSAADVLMRKELDGTWVEDPAPDYSTLAIVHLRADHSEVLIENDPVIRELRYRQFTSYRELWRLGKEVDDALKTRQAPPITAF